jgi:hypothetical protein
MTKAIIMIIMIIMVPGLTEGAPFLGIWTKSETCELDRMFCVCSDCSLSSSTGQPCRAQTSHITKIPSKRALVPIGGTARQRETRIRR